MIHHQALRDRRWRLGLAILGWIGLASPLVASDVEVRFQHLTRDDGLSQSVVLVILSDRRGFMWFATEDGLNRFDGSTFEVIRRDMGE